MAVTYPLFVFEKDCQSLQIIEDPGRIGILEAIDIVNGEYVFWDAIGNGVSVGASVTTFTSKIGDVTSCDSPFPLRDAFTLYARLWDGMILMLTEHRAKCGVESKKE